MSKQITHNGRTQSGSAWARELGITQTLLCWRLKHWSIERALTTSKRSGQRMITHAGRTQSASAWARELGITYHVLRWRLQHWPIKRALTTPLSSRGSDDHPCRSYPGGHGMGTRTRLEFQRAAIAFAARQVGRKSSQLSQE